MESINADLQRKRIDAGEGEERGADLVPAGAAGHPQGCSGKRLLPVRCILPGAPRVLTEAAIKGKVDRWPA